MKAVHPGNKCVQTAADSDENLVSPGGETESE